MPVETLLTHAESAAAERAAAAAAHAINGNVSFAQSSHQNGAPLLATPEPSCVAEPTGERATAVAESVVYDASSARAAEIAALDASAAANCAETEASLRRTTVDAQRALQTAHVITTRLSTQTETLSAVEAAQRDNTEEWRKGRREMRRTRHWYAAFAHWLRCGGSATFGGVATKTDGRALLGHSPLMSQRQHGTKSHTSAAEWMASPDEPLQGESKSHGASCEQSVSSAPARKAAEDAMPCLKHNEVPMSPTATRTSRLRGVLTSETSMPQGGQQHRADVELCDRLEPGVVEVRQLVKEMHEQALLHSEMLTSHIGRLDGVNNQSEKTIAKNVQPVQRR